MSSPSYAPAQWQLVLEVYVSSVSESVEFYTNLGFKVEWAVPEYFAQLAWEDGCILFLKSRPSDSTADSCQGVGNIRIMVADVDVKYAECQHLGYKMEQEIGDRQFVLRDFIVQDPDGFGVRFGSFLPDRGRKEQGGPDDEIVVRGC
jgi:catechol 2,3-dioxygenase-like lactoylglutathione lyase family enzyme